MNKRVRGTVLNVPVVHGNVAIPLGNKATNNCSHKWWIYLRPLDRVDLSHFIKHVEFCLHESFDPPVRRVSSMPYEISESGWGEFDAVIKVYFHDTAEKTVELFHPLRLFHNDEKDENSDKPVVSEHYDEIVFQDPSEKLLSLLKSTPRGPSVCLPRSHLTPHFKDFTGVEGMDLKRIQEARSKLREETLKRQERFEKLESERQALQREIAALSEEAS